MEEILILFRKEFCANSPFDKKIVAWLLLSKKQLKRFSEFQVWNCEILLVIPSSVAKQLSFRRFPHGGVEVHYVPFDICVLSCQALKLK